MDFYTPKFKSNIKQRCLSIVGVQMYNKLQTKIKNCKSINSFITQPKKSVISNTDKSNFLNEVNYNFVKK